MRRLWPILRTRSVADWMARLRAAEVPAAPVNNLDGAFAEPPVAQREMIVSYDHPEVGEVRLPGNPIKMSGMEGTPSHPAPRVGEHTDEVLGDCWGCRGSRWRIAEEGGGEVVRMQATS